MRNLVDEKRLGCLKNVGLCDVHNETWQEICQTLSLALKVVRAAQKIVISKSADKTREEIDGDVLIEIYEALAPFSQGEDNLLKEK